MFLFSVVEQHPHCLLLLTGNRINDDLKDLILVVNLLLLVLKNMLWLALIVQDVVRLRVGADEGSVLNAGEAEAGGEGEVAKAGRENLQQCEEDAQDWDWEEVDLQRGLWNGAR